LTSAPARLDPWTSEVRELTRSHREARAKALKIESSRRRAEWREHYEGILEAEAFRARSAPFPTLSAPLPRGDAGAWHAARARGHLQRFERVSDCQRVTTIEIACSRCGDKQLRGSRCRVALICRSCRGKIATEKRARLALARRTAIDLCAKRGLFRADRRGGRWSEKLVTLTIPHLPELGVKQRIELCAAAWRIFSKGFGQWLKQHRDAGHVDRQGHRLMRWFRNVEWTTGEDGDHLGHPHVHLWFLGPFLPGAGSTWIGPWSPDQYALPHRLRCADMRAAKLARSSKANVIRNLWRDALRQAASKILLRIGPARYKALPVEWSGPWSRKEYARRRAGPSPERWHWRSEIFGLDQVVVDVRACRPGRRSLEEVIKYLFKDTVAGGARLAPELWAQVYEAFDGKRTTQSSRGLMSLHSRELMLSGGYCEDVVTGEVREITIADVRQIRLPCACGHCGFRGHLRVSRRPMTELERFALEARRGLARASPQVPFLREVAVA
jgi:hypothetical protein